MNSHNKFQKRHLQLRDKIEGSENSEEVKEINIAKLKQEFW